MGLINKGWYGMFFACGIWWLADVSSVSASLEQTAVDRSVCSDKGLTLETSAKHQIPQAKNIPYQPLLIKPIFSVLAHAEKQFLSKLVFQCLHTLIFVPNDHMYSTTGGHFPWGKPVTEHTRHYSSNDHMYSTTGGHFPWGKPVTEHTRQYSPNDHMYSTTGGHFPWGKPVTEHTRHYSPNDHMYSTTGGNFPWGTASDITHSTAREEIRSLRSIFPYSHRSACWVQDSVHSYKPTGTINALNYQ